MVHNLQPGDPQLIGPYRLRGVLGAGGMGRVFLGVSADSRMVAVKVVRADLATDPDFRALFRREVEVACTVSGPYTAPVVDADLDGPVPWLATAYVPGPSLANAVTEHGPLPVRSVLELAAGLAEGLSAIHAAGVVHRDLKPSNVLLGPDGPRLIDFGISRASGATALTCPGLMIGSPGFMSPEQAEGLPVGPPSDIFSLGAVLAFAAAGEGPFGPGSNVALLYRVIHRPADLGHVPGQVRGLVQRCLVKDPALRPTARDLVAATGTARSVTVRLPEPATRDVTQHRPLTEAPEAVTAPVPAPVVAGQALVAPDLPASVASAEQAPPRPPLDRPRPPLDRPRPTQDRPQQRQDRPSWRRHWRPLTAAAIVAGLLGGAAAADLALTAAHHRVPAARSERPVTAARTHSPAISSAEPRTSPSAAARKTSPSSRRDGSVRLAGSTPAADTAPPTSANMPVATSANMSVAASARPSATASPTPRPYPSPSPSATPSPTSGGYGY